MRNVVYLSPADDAVLGVLVKQADRWWSPDDVAEALGYSRAPKLMATRRLGELEARGFVERERGSYRVTDRGMQAFSATERVLP